MMPEQNGQVRSSLIGRLNRRDPCARLSPAMSSTSHLPSLPPAVRAAVDPPRRPRPIGGVRARLGFPSPAEDFTEDALDLNQLLVRNEPATFFYRASGTSMRGLGIFDGDILVVDRSLSPQDGDLVVAIWDGNAPSCKTLKIRSHGIELHSAAPGTPPITIGPDIEVEAFVVTGVVREVKRDGRGRVRTV